MESQLVLFLALVAAELIFNAIVIGMIYLVFSKMTAKATEAVNELQSSRAIYGWLTTLQSASEQAAKTTGVVKDQITAIEPALERIRTDHADRLMKIDVRFKLICRVIHFTAETVESVVTWPIKKISIASSVVRGIVDFIRGSESDADASSRRTR